MSNFNLPSFMRVKADAVKDFGDDLHYYLPEAYDGKVLILTTGGLLQKLADKVRVILSQLKCYEVMTVERSSFEFAVSVAKKVSMEGFNVIIGFGGGTALDTAKYAAFVAGVKYIALPTALSNDGVCSPVSVLYAEGGRKHSFTSKAPDGLLIDTDIIINSPRLLLEAGAGDIVSNYTALYDWDLDCRHHGKRVDDFAYMLSERALNALLYSDVKSFSCTAGIKMLAQSLVLGGISMQVAGNSRPCSGSDHLFCHALDELYDHGLPHGIVVGIGTVCAAKLQGRDYQILTDFMHAYGIEIRPEKRGITEEMFVKAWMEAPATRPDRYTVLNTLDMSEDMFKELYHWINAL